MNNTLLALFFCIQINELHVRFFAVVAAVFCCATVTSMVLVSLSLSLLDLYICAAVVFPFFHLILSCYFLRSNDCHLIYRVYVGSFAKLKVRVLAAFSRRGVFFFFVVCLFAFCAPLRNIVMSTAFIKALLLSLFLPLIFSGKSPCYRAVLLFSRVVSFSFFSLFILSVWIDYNLLAALFFYLLMKCSFFFF